VAVVSAGRARIARGVLAGVVRAVALVEGARVAVGGAGRPTRLLDVGGAGGARARAGVSEVTLRRRRAAHRTRVARRVLAVDARAVALVQGAGVALVGTGRPARLPTVGGTRRSRAGACLGLSAFACGDPAGVAATRAS